MMNPTIGAFDCPDTNYVDSDNPSDNMYTLDCSAPQRPLYKHKYDYVNEY